MFYRRGGLASVGISLLVIGIGSFILPALDLQFSLILIFGEYGTLVSILCIAAGALLIGLPLLLRLRKEKGAEQAGAPEMNSSRQTQ